MRPRRLTDFEIQRHFQNEHQFNVVCSRNNLPTIKDWACVIYLDEYDIGTHWVPVYFKNNDATKILMILVLKIF